MQGRPTARAGRKVLSRVTLTVDRALPPPRDEGKTTSTNAVWIWDRLVLAAFWFAFVVFVRALMGIGHPNLSHAASATGAIPLHNTSGACAGAPGDRIRVSPVDQSGLLMCSHAVNSDPAKRNLIEGAPNVPTIHGLIGPPTEAPPYVPPNYDPRYDDFVPTPATFFDPEEYDDDGRPFALKIRLEGERDQAQGAQGWEEGGDGRASVE